MTTLQIYDLNEDILEIVLSYVSNKDFAKFSYLTSKTLTRNFYEVILKESYRHILLKWKLSTDKYPNAMQQLKMNSLNLQMYLDISYPIITELGCENNTLSEYGGLYVDGLKARFDGMIGIGNRSIMAQDPFPPMTKKSCNQLKYALIRLSRILNCLVKIVTNSICDLKKYMKNFSNTPSPRKILSSSKINSVFSLQRSFNSSNNLSSSSASLSSLSSLANHKPNSHNSSSKLFFSSPFQYELSIEDDDCSEYRPSDTTVLAPTAGSTSATHIATYIAPRSVAYYEVAIHSTSNIHPQYANECIAGQYIMRHSYMHRF